MDEQLTIAGVAPKKRRQRTSPTRDELLDVFASQWAIQHGGVYVPAAADSAMLGRMLGKLTREQVAGLPEAFGRYLRSTQPFHRARAWPLRDFCSNPGPWFRTEQRAKLPPLVKVEPGR